jgi:transcriptional repressor NrdR
MAMNCPSCGSPTRVLESRRAEDGTALRRRRECTGCGERFTTFERFQRPRLYVRKRNGRRQAFDRDKLVAALSRSAHKRRVSRQQIEALADRAQRAIEGSGGEISAERLASLCLDELRVLDPDGAYLQYRGTLAGAPNADFAEKAPI